MIELMKKRVWLFLSLLYVSGCASVYVEGADKVDKTYYPGIVSVNVTPGDGVTRVVTKSLGMVFGDGRVAAGWLEEDRVAVSDNCVIVLFQSDVSDVERIVGLLVETGVSPSQICVTKGSRENESNGG